MSKKIRSPSARYLNKAYYIFTRNRDIYTTSLGTFQQLCGSMGSVALTLGEVNSNFLRSLML